MRRATLLLMLVALSALAAGGYATQALAGSAKPLRAQLELMPQGLGSVLRGGVAVHVVCNRNVDGIATVSISTADARRGHIPSGRGRTVVIGRGTAAGIKAGTARLHLILSRAVAAKLGRLRHVALMVRMTLLSANGDRVTTEAVGRY